MKRTTSSSPAAHRSRKHSSAAYGPVNHRGLRHPSHLSCHRVSPACAVAPPRDEGERGALWAGPVSAAIPPEHTEFAPSGAGRVALRAAFGLPNAASVAERRAPLHDVLKALDASASCRDAHDQLLQLGALAYDGAPARYGTRTWRRVYSAAPALCPAVLAHILALGGRPAFHALRAAKLDFVESVASTSWSAILDAVVARTSSDEQMLSFVDEVVLYERWLVPVTPHTSSGQFFIDFSGPDTTPPDLAQFMTDCVMPSMGGADPRIGAMCARWMRHDGDHFEAIRARYAWADDMWTYGARRGDLAVGRVEGSSRPFSLPIPYWLARFEGAFAVAPAAAARLLLAGGSADQARLVGRERLLQCLKTDDDRARRVAFAALGQL